MIDFNWIILVFYLAINFKIKSRTKFLLNIKEKIYLKSKSGIKIKFGLIIIKFERL